MKTQEKDFQYIRSPLYISLTHNPKTVAGAVVESQFSLQNSHFPKILCFTQKIAGLFSFHCKTLHIPNNAFGKVVRRFHSHQSLEQGTLQSGKLYFQSIPHLTYLFKSGKARVIWEGQDSPCKLSLLCLKLQFHWACKVKKGQMVNKKFVSF